MLTRREVEGELRSLGFRASARERRAERERALRFVRGAFGVLVGIALLALLGVVNLLHSSPADLAFGHSTSLRATDWVSNWYEGQSTHHEPSLFFNRRRTWGPDDPGGHGHHRGD